jgi:hypothetical protein
MHSFLSIRAKPPLVPRTRGLRHYEAHVRESLDVLLTDGRPANDDALRPRPVATCPIGDGQRASSRASKPWRSSPRVVSGGVPQPDNQESDYGWTPESSARYFAEHSGA